MGAGGDASDVDPRQFERTRIATVKEDLTCLKSMWFNKVGCIAVPFLECQITPISGGHTSKQTYRHALFPRPECLMQAEK